MNLNENIVPAPPPPKSVFNTRKFVIIVAIAVLLIIGILFLLSIRYKKIGPDTTPPPKADRTTVDAFGGAPIAGEDYEKGTILFGLKNIEIAFLDSPMPQSLKDIFTKYHATDISRPFADMGIPSLANTYQLAVGENDNILNLMTDLQKDPNVSFAEPSYYSKVEEKTYYLEPFWQSQRYEMEAIDMPRAWAITKGSPSVTVAVIDSGVDNTHPDLKDNVVEGYFVKNENKPEEHLEYTSFFKGFPGDCAGEEGKKETHGTHVAGIIAASENEIGVIGVAPKIKIMPITDEPCNDAPGILIDSRTLEVSLGTITKEKQNLYLFELAFKDGVQIINYSQTIRFHSKIINDGLNSYLKHGMIIVVAAGNDYDEGVKVINKTPADNSKMIVVGAVKGGDVPEDFSSRGPTVTVVAPGTALSTLGSAYDYDAKKDIVWEGYGNKWGTSMAAPYVTGLVALVRSLHPDWSAGKVRCAIILGAEDKGAPGKDDTYGYGRINAYNTLVLKNVPENCEPYAEIITPQDNGGLPIGQPVNVTGTATSPDFDYYTLEYLSEGADPVDGWKLITKDTKQITEGDLGTWDITSLKEGNYQLKLTVYDTKKNYTISSIPVYIFTPGKETPIPSAISSPGTIPQAVIPTATPPVVIPPEKKDTGIKPVPCAQALPPADLSRITGWDFYKVDESINSYLTTGLFENCLYYRSDMEPFGAVLQIYGCGAYFDCDAIPASERNKITVDPNLPYSGIANARIGDYYVIFEYHDIAPSVTENLMNRIMQIITANLKVL